MMMELGIAILISLALFGSVLWVMPSPREKRLTEMRALAMSKGLKVRLLDARLQAKLFPWISDTHGFVMYEKPFASMRKPAFVEPYVYRAKGRHDGDEELLPELHRQMFQMIQKLRQETEEPESLEALVVTKLGVALLWRELGGEDQVKIVEAFLSGVHGAAEQLH